MGDDPMALLGLEGALKHYYYYYVRRWRGGLHVEWTWDTQGAMWQQCRALLQG
jgi:hypothetical protein